jgi:hypothetical protein
VSGLHSSDGKETSMEDREADYCSLVLQPLWALASDFEFHDHFTDGRAPWTSD